MLSRELFYRFILSRRAGSLVRVISRISIIGIWLGVFALVLIMSVMNGFNRSIQNRLIKLEPHLVVKFTDKLSFAEIKKHKVYDFLSQRKDMTTEAFAEQDVILRTEEGKIHGAVAKGVSKESLVRLVSYAEDMAGRGSQFVKDSIAEMKSGDIIMGLSLAEATGVFEGNEVTIMPPEGLLLPSGEIPIFTKGKVRNFVLTENEKIDKNTIFYVQEDSFPRLRDTAGIIRGLEVRLEDPDKTLFWQAEISKMGVEVVSWRDRNASLFFALKVEKAVIAILVGLSTLIAALSIISVMVLLLTKNSCCP
jgi:lipoprotein-releasing system permease protein